MELLEALFRSGVRVHDLPLRSKLHASGRRCRSGDASFANAVNIDQLRSILSDLSRSAAVSLDGLRSRLHQCAPNGDDLVLARLQARQATLRHDLQRATTYKEKRRIYKQLYALDFDDEAERQKRSQMYDVKLVTERLAELKEAALSNNPEIMLHLLESQLERNVGGICNPQLYYHAGLRTEPTIRQYQKVVGEVLQKLASSCAESDAPIDQDQMFERLSKLKDSFGRVALLCSGGGTMGMIHIGVIKQLFELGQLPEVISGSSAGAIVCAVLCSRTDSELPKILNAFLYGDLAVFVGGDEKSGLLARASHFYRHGSVYNSRNLSRVMKINLGDITFKEAYLHSGRVLNITVTRATDFAPLVLNYQSAGDVVIRSAVVASCALPGCFKPGKLLNKDPSTGRLVEGEIEYIDGSIGGDIPIAALEEQFQCNYFVVSQANPHVLGCFLLRDAVKYLHPQLDTLASAAMDKALSKLPDYGTYGKLVAGLFGQPYRGNVTLTPNITVKGLLSILTNPTDAFMDESSQTGEALTFPLLAMIKDHVRIERSLAQAVRSLASQIRPQAHQDGMFTAPQDGRSSRHQSAECYMTTRALAEDIDSSASAGDDEDDTDNGPPLADDISITSVTPPALSDAESDDADDLHFKFRSVPASPQLTSAKSYFASSGSRSAADLQELKMTAATRTPQVHVRRPSRPDITMSPSVPSTHHRTEPWRELRHKRSVSAGYTKH